MPNGPIPFSETNLSRRMKRSTNRQAKLRGVLFDVEAESALATVTKALSSPSNPQDVLSFSQLARRAMLFYRDAVVSSPEVQQSEYVKSREGTDLPDRKNRFRNNRPKPEAAEAGV